MCTYTGGKARIGKRIFEAISEYERSLTGDNDRPYLEPFVGMGGVLQHFAINHSREMIACDYQKCITSFWQEIQRGWIPSRISSEKYKEIKIADRHDAEYAFAAYGCSFRGSKWTKFYNDFMERAIKRIQKGDYVNVMSDVEFLAHKSYTEHDPHGMLVYCDPPYVGTRFDQRRTNLINFDTCQFWDTMREWSKDNIVIISERYAPEDFKSIFSLERKNTFNDTTLTEHLFVSRETSRHYIPKIDYN